MPEVLDVASALREFAGDPRRAGAFAAALGFEAVPSPVDLLGPSGGATPLRDFFEVRDDLFGIKSLFRVGSYRAGAAPVGLYAAELHEWGQRSSARDRARRRVARAVVELSDDSRTLVVLVPQESERTDPPEIEVVLPRVRTDTDSRNAFTTVRALVDTHRPSRFHRERIRALALVPDLSVAQVADQWRRAFSVEEVTRKFYSDYADVRDLMAQALVDENPGHPVVMELEEKERKDWATRQLGRVLFLWFLQAKRWLGYDSSGEGPATYLSNLWHEIKTSGGGYYRRGLHPLFFEAMAQPLNRRSAEVRSLLGEIPYLNGGLFRTNALEDRIDDCGPVDLPDSLFEPDPELNNSVLGLFSRYHFTTRESTPDDQSVDPDPELLGRVFENLCEGDARRQSGTFYTPREIVHFMCRQALHGWLSDQIDEDPDLIELVRLEAVEPQDVGEGELISPDKARRLEGALDAVRICDPAVGSGAFLLGAMQEIVQLRCGLALADGQPDEWIEQCVPEWKRGAIQWSLYGVDNNPEAVEVCHLRLWLSLVLDLPSPAKADPLPNLDFRVVAGDSLIDRVGDIVLAESLPVSSYLPPLELGDQVSQERRLIERWKREFETEHISLGRSRELRDNIVLAVQRILTAYVDAELTRERLAANAPKPRGLSTVQQRRKLDRSREAAQKRVRLLEGARAELNDQRGFWKPFLWPVLFREAFQDGGFDLVLANPPYIRSERQDRQDEVLWRALFPEVAGSRADILVYFYARALQILRKGGWLAFVTSNKYMRAQYGQGLREHLQDSLSLTRIADFGDLPLFDSDGKVIAAYPAVLVGSSTPVSEDSSLEVADLTWPVRRTLAEEGRSTKPETVRDALTDLDTLLHVSAVRDFPQALLRRDGWILQDSTLVRLFDRIMSRGTPLGEYAKHHINYGIKTGLNSAFVIDRATRDSLVEADPASAKIIEPWLRGKDIKRWKAQWAGQYLIKLQSSSDGDTTNPWAESTHEDAARRIFADSFPAIHDHMSRFEDRLRRRSDQGRFWWELRACAYYTDFKRPKVIFDHFISTPDFAYDDSGMFHNNACTFACSDHLSVVAIVSSRVTWWLLNQLTTRLLNGYLQLFVNVIERLPIPKLSAEQERQLSSLVSQLLADPLDANAESVAEELVEDAFDLSSLERRLIREWFESNSIAKDPGK